MKITAEMKGAHGEDISISMTNHDDLDAFEMAAMLYNLMRAIDYADTSIYDAFITIAEERSPHVNAK